MFAWLISFIRHGVPKSLQRRAACAVIAALRHAARLSLRKACKTIYFLKNEKKIYFGTRRARDV